ncbi:preprotein translocase, SecE subunit, bacterial [Longilinea arvoryzae]|uniref:Protein translocase subunit SecE n=1 Tax=Longilinea arvoryzae TaxID=360412 RepID=A0A0S7BHB2_9CHLR|nr:preprotein translocase subunit SecE [Longilinea arvoryzae]GAP13125.1 preprotein translocase, SecE subunit, bacterial [Longilinea arvoryzae]
MAEKIEKAKEMTKAAAKAPEKSKQIVKAAAKAPEKAKQGEKKSLVTRIKKWWRETIGELHKVTWPTPQEAWRLTKIVLAVMAIMAIVLGLLDLLFSFLVGLILA